MTYNKMMDKKEFSEAMRKEMSRHFPECDITVKSVPEKEDMQGLFLFALINDVLNSLSP